MSFENESHIKNISDFFAKTYIEHKDISNHQYQLNFLYSKFIAMKEIDFDNNKEQQVKHSTLQFTNSFVYTNFYETERDYNELLNLVSEM